MRELQWRKSVAEELTKRNNFSQCSCFQNVQQLTLCVNNLQLSIERVEVTIKLEGFSQTVLYFRLISGSLLVWTVHFNELIQKKKKTVSDSFTSTSGILRLFL